MWMGGVIACVVSSTHPSAWATSVSGLTSSFGTSRLWAMGGVRRACRTHFTSTGEPPVLDFFKSWRFLYSGRDRRIAQDLGKREGAGLSSVGTGGGIRAHFYFSGVHAQTEAAAVADRGCRRSGNHTGRGREFRRPRRTGR